MICKTGDRAAYLTLAFAAALAGQPALAETAKFTTQKGTIAVETLASGLENPWAVDVLSDGAYIVTERPGRLRIIRDGKLGAPVSGLPEVFAEGQGGLLDVAVSPTFTSDRTLFLTAALAYDGGAGTAVIRARLSADETTLENVETIFRMKKVGTTGRHFGARIAFAPDGSLFFGIGERGDDKRAQDFFDHAGSILHINADGSIPKDNPFRDGKTGLPEIWSKGHRNPQGIFMDTENNRLMTVEHGARGGDEINIPKPGRNYGWPVITYGIDYDGSRIGKGVSAAGLEQPEHYWDPSIAPGAMVVHSGRMFAEWKGDIIVTSLKFGFLSRIAQDAPLKIVEEERLLEDEYGRMRDVIEAPDGALLVVTDEQDGRLLRITPSDTKS